MTGTAARTKPSGPDNTGKKTKPEMSSHATGLTSEHWDEIITFLRSYRDWLRMKCKTVSEVDLEVRRHGIATRQDFTREAMVMARLELD